MRSIWLCILALHLSSALVSAAPTIYAVAEQAIPVYSNPADAANTAKAKTDSCGQVRSLEFVAFPDTVFTVVRRIGPEPANLLEVITSDYLAPPGVRLYISSAGIRLLQHQPPERSRPATFRQAELLTRLRSAIGTNYVWGANLRSGVTINGKQGIHAGLDCSGLLYEATNGFTPRNTSELVYYGKPVPVVGLSREQIITRLKPLDLLVWKGHVVIVLDKGQAIESILQCNRPGRGGVIVRPLNQRLTEIMAQRKGRDNWPDTVGKADYFVVRRWLE